MPHGDNVSDFLAQLIQYQSTPQEDTWQPLPPTSTSLPYCIPSPPPTAPAPPPPAPYPVIGPPPPAFWAPYPYRRRTRRTSSVPPTGPTVLYDRTGLPIHVGRRYRAYADMWLSHGRGGSISFVMTIHFVSSPITWAPEGRGVWTYKTVGVRYVEVK